MQIVKEIHIPQIMSLANVKVRATTVIANLVCDGEVVTTTLEHGVQVKAILTLFASDIASLTGWSDMFQARAGDDYEEQVILFSQNRTGLKKLLDGLEMPVTIVTNTRKYNTPRRMNGKEVTDYDVLEPKSEIGTMELDFVPWKREELSEMDKAIAAAHRAAAIADAEVQSNIITARAHLARMEAAAELAELQAAMTKTVKPRTPRATKAAIKPKQSRKVTAK